MKAKRLIHKPSGKWFWMHARLIFGVPYYSANNGASWHPTKLLAFTRAAESDLLDLAESPKGKTQCRNKSKTTSSPAGLG